VVERIKFSEARSSLTTRRNEDMKGKRREGKGSAFLEALKAASECLEGISGRPIYRATVLRSSMVAPIKKRYITHLIIDAANDTDAEARAMALSRCKKPLVIGGLLELVRIIYSSKEDFLLARNAQKVSRSLRVQLSIFEEALKMGEQLGEKGDHMNLLRKHVRALRKRIKSSV